MKYSLLACATFMSLCCSPAAFAWDWRVETGVHDFIVNQADSHTPGINATFSLIHPFGSKSKLMGDIALYYDHDKDKLDPDHIPIWFSSSYLLSQEWLRLSPYTSFGGQLMLSGRRNTVSGIEKQFKVFPGMAVSYDDGRIMANVDLSFGYYLMELDDDVPKTAGYHRGEFSHDAGAFSAGIATHLQLSQSFAFIGSARNWHDGNDWLEYRYSGGFTLHHSAWQPGTLLQLEAVYHQYNLAPYNRGDVPILPWNRDLKLQLGFSFAL